MDFYFLHVIDGETGWNSVSATAYNYLFVKLETDFPNHRLYSFMSLAFINDKLCFGKVSKTQ